jgi:hypothetical protein
MKTVEKAFLKRFAKERSSQVHLINQARDDSPKIGKAQN